MIKPFVFTSLVLFMASVNATYLSARDFPKELLFLGKPIDSLCFDVGADAKNIQLPLCGIAKDMTVVHEGTNLSQKGFIGYDWQQNNVTYQSRGYSYYQAFNAGNKQYWIYSLNNGGGTGSFTSIDLVKRTDDNTLAIKHVAGGDRCNGGVHDVDEINHRLTFSVNLTPYDFFMLANGAERGMKAYDDLATCAICCLAKAIYQVDTTLKTTLQYIDISEMNNKDALPTQGTQQACFNKVFATFIDQSKKKLDTTNLKKFIEAFNAMCLTKHN